jgi:hypothetical protein
MDVILTERFKSLLQRSESNLLSLLSCGALSSSPESRNTIQKIADQYVIFQIS